ncbi:hypothetical protein FRC15_007418 [Serendipita sp. 397]|nr:hypothetical protein FRC15_007418 [Serendipita sp. 397]
MGSGASAFFVSQFSLYALVFICFPNAVYRFNDLSLAANIVAEKTDRQRALSSSQEDDLQQVINFCYDSVTCRRYHILAPFQVDNKWQQTGKDWLRRILEWEIEGPKLNCGKCDNCDAYLDRKLANYKELSRDEIDMIEACFKTDLELTASSFVEQVADRLDISRPKAREMVEFLAAAGVLKLRFYSTDSGRDNLSPFLSKSPQIVEDFSWLPPPPAPRVPPKSGIPGLVINSMPMQTEGLEEQSSSYEFDSDSEDDGGGGNVQVDISEQFEGPTPPPSNRPPRNRRFEDDDSFSSSSSEQSDLDDHSRRQRVIDKLRKVVFKQAEVRQLHLRDEQLAGTFKSIVDEVLRREDQYLDEGRLAKIISRHTSSKGQNIQLLGTYISDSEMCGLLIREVFAGLHVTKRVRQL